MSPMIYFLYIWAKYISKSRGILTGRCGGGDQVAIGHYFLRSGLVVGRLLKQQPQWQRVHVWYKCRWMKKLSHGLLLTQHSKRRNLSCKLCRFQFFVLRFFSRRGATCCSSAPLPTSHSILGRSLPEMNSWQTTFLGTCQSEKIN